MLRSFPWAGRMRARRRARSLDSGADVSRDSSVSIPPSREPRCPVSHPAPSACFHVTLRAQCPPALADAFGDISDRRLWHLQPPSQVIIRTAPAPKEGGRLAPRAAGSRRRAPGELTAVGVPCAAPPAGSRHGGACVGPDRFQARAGTSQWFLPDFLRVCVLWGLVFMMKLNIQGGQR